MGHAQPGMGHAQPGMGHAQPGMGHDQPGMGHAQPGMGHAQPMGPSGPGSNKSARTAQGPTIGPERPRDWEVETKQLSCACHMLRHAVVLQYARMQCAKLMICLLQAIA